MRRKLIIAMAMLIVPAIGTKTQVPEMATEKQIDTVFSGVTSPDAPGLAVLVRAYGQTVFERGYGVRELRSKAKIDAHTNFRLASFTKQFTAMAIMLLVHDGKLRYDETLTELFPDFPAYGKTITVRNLLNHTSGLPDYEDLMDAAEKAKGPLWSPEKQIQDDEVLELLKKEKNGKFAPGTSWSYSNSGYVVLGIIVAKVSGKPYGEFLQERIFAPLKMNHTIVYQKGKNEVAESRLRPFQRRRHVQRNRPKFNFRDSRRRRHLFESRRSRQVGRRPAQSHLAERKRIPARSNARET